MNETVPGGESDQANRGHQRTERRNIVRTTLFKGTM